MLLLPDKRRVGSVRRKRRDRSPGSGARGRHGIARHTALRQPDYWVQHAVQKRKTNVIQFYNRKHDTKIYLGIYLS